MTTAEDVTDIRMSISIALKSDTHLDIHLPAYISGRSGHLVFYLLPTGIDL